MSHHEIDITEDICPFTFVKTKLLVERMRPGETAQVRLRGLEPLRNVPRSLREHGHEIISMEAERGQGPDGVHRLVLRKKADAHQ
ncbi:sulfurtransferase TusA family protein [Roseospira marina]|uniref:Sulfurtransferase TusA family protein n=1 Tax=Roseospira marina TaxID=140057 RepID=A0A5M6IAS4_9PROT|nr:sulfurtransferase TusA family protein [Roseospira marina]KAA5605384.1 sulfurtransferase TusA family protein [Roseospira marina]MBB4314630.1 TusA-related sulfurtransferase [Roseospira marina]MBB5088765.1 TusA-related sulfurtransferase [Roseospira marina]